MDQQNSRETLLMIRENLRGQQKIVGYTSGVFDLMHPGHIDYLAAARAQCDFLIVGVNSDGSVRENKGPSRPIQKEQDRLAVVRALRSVDRAFLFSEKNNNENIRTLKPDIYFKAGDYSKEQLTSAPLVEAYGGKVILIPPLLGHSTTGIINHIQGQALHGSPQVIHHEPAPAIFLDRDGTLIKDIGYLHEVGQVVVYQGAWDALRKMVEAGYRLVMVTNQPGIGLGYFSKEQMFQVHLHLMKEGFQNGVLFHKMYYCPHSLAERCGCRKPSLDLFFRAKEELNIMIERSFVIGDMTSDIASGERLGCRTILVETGQGGRDGKFEVHPTFIAKDLVEAAEISIRELQKEGSPAL